MFIVKIAQAELKVKMCECRSDLICPRCFSPKLFSLKRSFAKSVTMAQPTEGSDDFNMFIDGFKYTFMNA